MNAPNLCTLSVYLCCEERRSSSSMNQRHTYVYLYCKHTVVCWQVVLNQKERWRSLTRVYSCVLFSYVIPDHLCCGPVAP